MAGRIWEEKELDILYDKDMELKVYDQKQLERLVRLISHL